MKLNKKQIIGIILSLTVIISIAVGIYFVQQKEAGKKSDDNVTQEEIQKYKEMIGDGMDIKKSVLILFDTYDECRSFINKFGAEDNPQMHGQGTVAYMPDGYYNIVGKSILEECFDNLSDGEYTTEPVEYSGMYCYLKRLGVESPVDDEEELKNIILNDKNPK